MLNPDLTLADLVTEHPASARVLQAHRLDFCCRGERTLGQACAERGIDAAAVLAELERAVHGPRPPTDLRSLSTAALIEHIVERHHGYLREALPFVSALSSKVARVHGDHNPNLVGLASTVADLCAALEPHLDREERELFPALLDSTTDRTAITQELDSMTEEHRHVGALLDRLRTHADDYSVPEWACRSYRALFSELERLEVDVLTHVHAENHVLLPRC